MVGEAGACSYDSWYQESQRLVDLSALCHVPKDFSLIAWGGVRYWHLKKLPGWSCFVTGLRLHWPGGKAHIFNQDFKIKKKKSMYFSIHDVHGFQNLDLCSVNRLASNKIKFESKCYYYCLKRKGRGKEAFSKIQIYWYINRSAQGKNSFYLPVTFLSSPAITTNFIF